MLLGAALVLLSAGNAALAQESRQDVSVSGFTNWQPQINGNGARLNSSMSLGGLLSYRYLITPRSGLELNYGYTEYTDYFKVSFTHPNIHVRQQEVTAAYVYSRNYGNFNPFLEVGTGAYFLSAIRDWGTTSLDAKRNTKIGGLFGGGLAYEISPSFDVRIEYRAFLMKAPNFGLTDVNTNRFTVVSTPAVGIAYHF